MRQVLLLVLVCVIFGFTAETQRTPRDETLVEIVKAGQSRHPYQEEYEQMLYPTVRISSPAGTGSGVIFHRTFAKLSVNSYTETAEKEKTILEVILKCVFALWSQRALRENMVFIV